MPSESIYEIIDIDEKTENCGACGLEVETYYFIRNKITGKAKWVNKRFAHVYGLH